MKLRILLMVTIVLIFLASAVGCSSANSASRATTKQSSATVTDQTMGTSSVRDDVRASAALTTTQNPYPPYKGTLLLNASLRKSTKTPLWDEGATPHSGSCQFAGGAYHATIVQANQFWYCTDESLTVSDFAYQIQMTILKGDYSGIAFRNVASGSLYYFYVDTKGHYELDVNRNHQFIKTISSGTSSAIKTGYNQFNLLGVVAQGNSFDLYINVRHITHVSDATLSQGHIGVLVSESSHPTEGAFQDAKLWKL